MPEETPPIEATDPPEMKDLRATVRRAIHDGLHLGAAAASASQERAQALMNQVPDVVAGALHAVSESARGLDPAEVLGGLQGVATRVKGAVADYLSEQGLVDPRADGEGEVRVDAAFVRQHGAGLAEAVFRSVRGPAAEAPEPETPVAETPVKAAKPAPAQTSPNLRLQVDVGDILGSFVRALLVPPAARDPKRAPKAETDDP